MKLENQVCTRQQAQRLKELGVGQSSIFSWFGDDTRRLMDNGATSAAVYGPWLWVGTTFPPNNEEEDRRENVCCRTPLAAAFTVGELGQTLPHLNHQGHSFKGLDSKYWYHTWQKNGKAQPVFGPYDTEAQARATFLIYLLENNYITAAEVNARLEKEDIQQPR